MVDVDQAFLRRFATDWFEAWNSGDSEQVLDLVHPDVIWEDSAFAHEPIEGREAVRGYCEWFWRLTQGADVEEIQSFFAPEDERAVILYRQRGVGGPDVAPGRRFDVTGCVIFMEFTDGLLSWYVTQYDLHELRRQLGMPSAEKGVSVG